MHILVQGEEKDTLQKALNELINNCGQSILNYPYYGEGLRIDQQKSTPLVAAAAAGRIANIRMLIDYGANPCIFIRQGYITLTPKNVQVKQFAMLSPLFAAACNRQTKTVEFLLKKGARIYEPNPVTFFEALSYDYVKSPPQDDNKESLNCLLLLLSAVKTQQPQHFVEVLNECASHFVNNGFTNHVHLLLGFGVQLKINCFWLSERSLTLSNIKFCHEQEIIN